MPVLDGQLVIRACGLALEDIESLNLLLLLQHDEVDIIDHYQLVAFRKIRCQKRMSNSTY